MQMKILIFAALALFSAVAFAAKPQVVTIEAQDNLRFSVKEIAVKPGETITIKLVNNTTFPAAAMSHNFVLLKNSADPQVFAQAAIAARANNYFPQDKADLVIAHTKMLGGGESDTITFTAPEEPGMYTYICTFPGHFAAGMVGTLVVKAK